METPAGDGLWLDARVVVYLVVALGNLLHQCSVRASFILALYKRGVGESFCVGYLK